MCVKERDRNRQLRSCTYMCLWVCMCVTLLSKQSISLNQCIHVSVYNTDYNENLVLEQQNAGAELPNDLKVLRFPR